MRNPFAQYDQLLAELVLNNNAILNYTAAPLTQSNRYREREKSKRWENERTNATRDKDTEMEARDTRQEKSSHLSRGRIIY